MDKFTKLADAVTSYRAFDVSPEHLLVYVDGGETAIAGDGMLTEPPDPKSHVRLIGDVFVAREALPEAFCCGERRCFQTHISQTKVMIDPSESRILVTSAAEKLHPEFVAAIRAWEEENPGARVYWDTQGCWPPVRERYVVSPEDVAFSETSYVDGKTEIRLTTLTEEVIDAVRPEGWVPQGCGTWLRAEALEPVNRKDSPIDAICQGGVYVEYSAYNIGDVWVDRTSLPDFLPGDLSWIAPNNLRIVDMVASLDRIDLGKVLARTAMFRDDTRDYVSTFATADGQHTSKVLTLEALTHLEGEFYLDMKPARALPQCASVSTSLYQDHQVVLGERDLAFRKGQAFVVTYQNGYRRVWLPRTTVTLKFAYEFCPLPSCIALDQQAEEIAQKAAEQRHYVIHPRYIGVAVPGDVPRITTLAGVDYIGEAAGSWDTLDEESGMVYRADMAVEVAHQSLGKHIDTHAAIIRYKAHESTVVATRAIADQRFVDYLGDYQYRCVII